VKRVLVTDGLQTVGVDALRKHGLDVEVVGSLSERDLVARVGEYEGLIVRSATKVTRAVIEAARRLEVIGRAGAGVDSIDVDAATERGVIVMNTPGANTTAVAEHTMGLLLALARRLPAADVTLKAGRWEKSRLQGVELFGKVLGILGLGRIGSEVARRATGFRMQVVAYDPYLTREAAERLGPRHGRERARERGHPPVAGHPENGAQREPEQPPDHDAAPSRWPFSAGRRQPGSGASGASRGSLGRGSILALAVGGRDPLPPPPGRRIHRALFTP